MPRVVKSAEVRRDEILDCALKLFATQGYEATSVNQIIAALGLSKGAFYHHFAAKQDLIEAMAARFADDAAASARPVLDDESLDAFSRLSGFLASMRQSKVAASVEIRNAFEPLFRDENLRLYQRTHEAVIAVVRPILAGIIAAGVEERTFDTPHPDWAADIILQMLGTTRTLVADIYHAHNTAQFEHAASCLLARFRYIGTVVDRILGLPEGSIVLADERSIEDIMAAWRQGLAA